MHESTLLDGMMKQLKAIARENDAERIVGVKVRLGALSNIAADHFREHFEEAVAGTVAEGAHLEIEESMDIQDEHAQDIMIESVDLDVPE